MQPRLIFRTHYQVDEPAYMKFLIKLCTSAVQSTYTEVVARDLAQEIRARCKEFNEAAGRYAVDLARALNLITPNNTWTDKGFLVNLIANVADGQPEEQLSLTLPEKFLHFRLFLEADGAAFIFIARYLTQHGSLPKPDASVNLLVQEMFVTILGDYLSVTNNTPDRVALREAIDRLKRNEYHGNSGTHKLFIHAQTLYRMGLAGRDDTMSRVYYLPDQSQDTAQSLANLLREVPDILALERVVISHGLVELAADVFPVPHVTWQTKHYEDTLRLLGQFYQRVASTGAPLCSLSTLIEAIQISLLANGILLTHGEALSIISDVQQQHSKAIRFHVDRRGQPSFVKMSDEMVNVLVTGRTIA
jgi:hypothetical protein